MTVCRIGLGQTPEASAYEGLDPLPVPAQAEPAESDLGLDYDPGDVVTLSRLVEDLGGGTDVTVPATQGLIYEYLDDLAARYSSGQVRHLGTLLVDRQWTIGRTIRLPPTMTLAGVSSGGLNVFVAADATSFVGDALIETREDAGPPRYVTIRDLHLVGPRFPPLPFVPADPVVGIKMAGASRCAVERVRIIQCDVGIFGARSSDIRIEDCAIQTNGTQIVLFHGNRTWRIMDCALQQSSRWVIRIMGPADGPAPRVTPGGRLLSGIGWNEDVLIQGCDIEQPDIVSRGHALEGFGGVLAAGYGIVVDTCRFEGTGPGPEIEAVVPICTQPSRYIGGGTVRCGDVKFTGNYGLGVRVVIPEKLAALHPPTGVWGNGSGYGIASMFNSNTVVGPEVIVEQSLGSTPW